ncbi:MAG: hypothetical protein ACE5I5_18150 [Candidatus Heimdallarchaeota archaeon]
MGENNKFFDIHHEDILRLERKFAGYWTGLDKYDIRSWLLQFEMEHRELGLKLLHHVDYYSQSRVIREVRQIHEQILALAGGTLQDTYFASFTPPGKSGDELLPRYRLGSGLRSRRYDQLFVHISGLVDFFDKQVQRFVFVDDFIGTGTQAINIWNNIGGFLTEVEDVFLSVIVGFDEGIKNVERETPMKVIVNRRLFEEAKIFSLSNRVFTPDEKIVLRDYCERAGSWPEGYGGCQSIIVFSHRAPNNTISILRCDTPNWRGLFARY